MGWFWGADDVLVLDLGAHSTGCAFFVKIHATVHLK